MKRLMKRLQGTRWARGATMVEYGLIVALIALGLVGVLFILTGQLNVTFTDVVNALNKGP